MRVTSSSKVDKDGPAKTIPLAVLGYVRPDRPVVLRLKGCDDLVALHCKGERGRLAGAIGDHGRVQVAILPLQQLFWAWHQKAIGGGFDEGRHCHASLPNGSEAAVLHVGRSLLKHSAGIRMQLSPTS